MEREGFIAALLPICDFVCEYDRRREKLRVRRSEIAPELAGSRWYTVDALSDALRSKGSIIAERGAWVHYLTNDNLRRFFTEQQQGKSFRLRFRQSGMGYRQYDVRIDLVDSNTLVISGRDTQAQEVDALTGALNRSHYERDMAGEIFNGGVAIIDMDDLKLFNDLYGHGAGDAALRTIAEVVHSVVGERGSLVRYGGDEFCCWCPRSPRASSTSSSVKSSGSSTPSASLPAGRSSTPPPASAALSPSRRRSPARCSGRIASCTAPSGRRTPW